MKRLIALLFTLCCLLPAMALAHDGTYIGTMEVVNCQEWVSLREEPSASSARLCKVSLGSTVRHARYLDEEWYSVAYDGYQGYIQSRYLQPTEGTRTFQVMVVTYSEGVQTWMDMAATIPGGETLPAGTMVRNCCLMDGGLAYVEYDGRCFFVDALYLTPLEQLALFTEYPPMRITTDFAFDAEGAPEPTLQAVWADFSSENDTLAEFSTTIPIGRFRLFQLEYLDSTEDGSFLFEAIQQPQFSLETLTPDEVMIIDLPYLGTIPNVAVSYQDHYGVTHLFLVGMSGEDGSLILKEI